MTRRMRRSPAAVPVSPLCRATHMRAGMESPQHMAKTLSRCCDCSFQSITLKTSYLTIFLMRSATRRSSSSRSRMEVTSRLTSYKRARVWACSGCERNRLCGTGSASPNRAKASIFERSAMKGAPGALSPLDVANPWKLHNANLKQGAELGHIDRGEPSVDGRRGRAS